MKPYKFSKHSKYEFADVQCSYAAKLRENINNGIKLSREDKNYITKHCNNNSYFTFGIPLGGWCFPFNDVLNTYVVKQHSEWREYQAIDKTALRLCIYGRIQKIIEVV